MDLFLDRLSLADLKGDREKAKLITEFQASFRGALSRQRRAVASRLTAILSTHARPMDFKGWQRVVDYQYSRKPLSAHGSVLSETGGRFNVGDVDQLNLRPFPALYLAADRKTAFYEKYGLKEGEKSGKLSASEAALSQSASIACVSVRGHLEICVNVDDRKCLKKLCEVFSAFEIPLEAQRLARRISQKPLSVTTSPDRLLKTLMEPNWRQWSLHYDLLANSQHFGQIAWQAGIEALAFPSAKGSSRCLAIYPENFKDSIAYVALEGAAPAGVKDVRLDKDTLTRFI